MQQSALRSLAIVCYYIETTLFAIVCYLRFMIRYRPRSSAIIWLQVCKFFGQISDGGKQASIKVSEKDEGRKKEGDAPMAV